MPILNLRDLLAYPPGDNATDSVIGGVHFNLTTLNHWNYTLYSNGTLSNGSWCILTNPPYTPTLLYPNGSFVNSTWCYTPVNPMGTRAWLGIAFATLFGAALLLQLTCLRKHGKLYLPVTRRFYPIGRRWQWYWGLWVCAMAIISLFTNIDVDRYYVVQIPIILTSFFWFLMQWGALALIWEAARHWGSWLERQLIDPNPFMLREDDRRAKIEFWLPLWFYLWLWLNFFMIVPRKWAPLELQRDPDQTALNARPMATDGRFRAAGFCLAVCFATICFSLVHSLVHYRHALPLSSPDLNSSLRRPPLRWVLLVPLAAIIVAYQTICGFNFNVSPLNAHGTNLVAVYAGGYAPSLAILLVQVVYGFAAPNEDRELMRQRRIRGAREDAALGIVRKPAWWRRVHDAADELGSGKTGGGIRAGAKGMAAIIARNVRELQGGSATARGVQEGARNEGLELEAVGQSPREGTSSTAASPTQTQPSARVQHGTVSRRRWPGSLHWEDPAEREAAAAAQKAAADDLMRRAEQHRYLTEAGPPPSASPSTASQPPPPYRASSMIDDALSGERRGRSTTPAPAPGRGNAGALDGIGQQLLQLPSRTPSTATGATGGDAFDGGTVTPASSERSRSTGTLVSVNAAGRAPQTRVRSMLNV